MTPFSWPHVQMNGYLRGRLLGGSSLPTVHEPLHALSVCGLVEGWKVSDRVARERVASLERRRREWS